MQQSPDLVSGMFSEAPQARRHAAGSHRCNRCSLAFAALHHLQRRLLGLVDVVGEDTGWEWTEVLEKLMSEWDWPDSEKSLRFVSSRSRSP